MDYDGDGTRNWLMNKKRNLKSLITEYEQECNSKKARLGEDLANWVAHKKVEIYYNECMSDNFNYYDYWGDSNMSILKESYSDNLTQEERDIINFQPIVPRQEITKLYASTVKSFRDMIHGFFGRKK